MVGAIKCCWPEIEGPTKGSKLGSTGQRFFTVGEKVTTTPTILTVGEPKNVGPNSFPSTKVIKVC